MTGPEHYQLAEVAQQAAAATQGEKLSYTPTEALLDALVHATLALADAQGANRPPLIVAVPENLSDQGAENIREAVARAMGKQL